MSIDTFKSLLWWVAIPLLLLWMMRRSGGCGMMGHGHPSPGSADDEGSRSRSSGKPVDPVCGMQVDPAQAVATRTVAGSTFFLCSATCLEAFEKDPGLYAERGPGGVPRRHRHVGC